MRLIDADKIKFTEYANGDITVSKEAIQNIPTAYEPENVIARIRDALSDTPLYRHKFCGTVKEEHCYKQNDCEHCIAGLAIHFIKSEFSQQKK